MSWKCHGNAANVKSIRLLWDGVTHGQHQKWTSIMGLQRSTTMMNTWRYRKRRNTTAASADLERKKKKTEKKQQFKVWVFKWCVVVSRTRTRRRLTLPFLPNCLMMKRIIKRARRDGGSARGRETNLTSRREADKEIKG